MGEFDRLYDKKKDQTYICKDAEARNQIDALELKSREICTTFEFAGSYDSTEDRNFTYLLPFNSIKGRFFGEDGTYIRVLFNDTYTLDFTKPLYFVFDDYSVPITEDQRKTLPAYRNRGGTESMAGWFDYDSVLDFVYDKDDQCFYMVNAQKASTTAYGQTILSSDTQSTSEATAATSLAVKTVRDMISSATGVDIQVVNSLPTTNISQHTIYLVPKQTAGTNNVYDEYVNTDGTSAGWELIGDTTVDLSNYYTKTEADNLLGNKVDKVTGKGLSTNDYTTNEQTKLASIAAGAEVNVQSNWNESDTTSDAYIQNKPSIPTALSDLSDDSTHRVVTDTEKSTWSGKVSDNPTFSEASTRANIASGESFSTILGKIKKFFTDLKTVAFTGSYNDLTDKPSIPSGQVQSDWSQSDTTAVDFIKNKPTIPSALSDLSDDSTHRVVTDTEKSTWSGKVSDNPTFSEAGTRANIASGESFATILGKIKKYFSDLKTVAFTGSYSDLSNTPNLANVATSGDYTDLSNKPTIPTVTWRPITLETSQYTAKDIRTANDDGRIRFRSGSNMSISDGSDGDLIFSATDTKPSNFATQTSAQEAAVSIGSDTNWHRIRQILGMTAGKLYLVEVSLMYPSATGGFRSIGISTSATNSSGYPDPSTSMGGNFFENVAPVSGAVTNITLTTFFTPASGETYYLCGRQNSGGSLSITPRYRIVQLN